MRGDIQCKYMSRVKSVCFYLIESNVADRPFCVIKSSLQITFKTNHYYACNISSGTKAMILHILGGIKFTIFFSSTNREIQTTNLKRSLNIHMLVELYSFELCFASPI